MALQFRRGLSSNLPSPSDAAIGEPLFTTDDGKLRIKKGDGTYAVIGSGTTVGNLDLSGIAAGSLVKVNAQQDGFVAAAGGDLPAHNHSLSQLSGPLDLDQLPTPPNQAAEATLKWVPGSGWIIYQQGSSAETIDFYSWFEPVGYSTFAEAITGGFASGVANLSTIGSFGDPDTDRVITYSLPAGFNYCYFIHEDDENPDNAAFGWNPAFYSPGLGALQTLDNLGRAQINLGDGVKWHRMWRLEYPQGNQLESIAVELGVT